MNKMKANKMNKITIPDKMTMRTLLQRMFPILSRTTHLHPHPGLIIAEHHFNEPYPIINECELLCLVVMDLLNQFAYPCISGYAKFTIGLTMNRTEGEDISFTLKDAIPLTVDDGSQLLPAIVVYYEIYKKFLSCAEKYEGVSVLKVMIRVYLEIPYGHDKESIAILRSRRERTRKPQSDEMREEYLYSIFADSESVREPLGGHEMSPREIRNRKRSYPRHIPVQKLKVCDELSSFIVADLETLLIDNVHVPYAAGLLMVRPGDDLTSLKPVEPTGDAIEEKALPYAALSNDPLTAPSSFTRLGIDTYFSEDVLQVKTEKPVPTFEERSRMVLYDFIKRIESLSRRAKKAFTIYFHNGSRFDGVILLKHLTLHHKYKLKPLIRNNVLYELSVYDSKGNKLLFRFTDSMKLLPGSLATLAENLCPELGKKGEIAHDEVTQYNVGSQRKVLINYLKQDILLLGGVMKKAKEIYYKQYKIDIECVLTISSLAITIFRSQYYNESDWPIHIPNKNEDSFIRGCYYGGHVDVYKPKGQNLYYYDINSLYPYIMTDCALPGGVPVWHADLKGCDLDSICGFIRAYVKCPLTINKPFLPYRKGDDDTIIFPTGEFVGDYYSDELSFARKLGYTVLPISGYLFERKESPFKEYVSKLYESRLEARRKGGKAIALLCKNLLNSLYGRFGISPKSSKSEICDQNRYNYLLRWSDFQFGDRLDDNKYIVTYLTGTDDSYWKPPKNSAVQLAAAITARARIFMYPFISRDDCYYTDTDSVVLGEPLAPEYLSETVLGKFKLEARIVEGIFLAAKSYCYMTIDSDKITRYKGAGSDSANYEWFESQYMDLSRRTEVKTVSRFLVDRRALNVRMKESKSTLQIKVGSKRLPVYNNKGLWVDTLPMEINDFSLCEKTIISYLWEENRHLKEELERVKAERPEQQLEEVRPEVRRARLKGEVCSSNARGEDSCSGSESSSESGTDSGSGSGSESSSDSGTDSGSGSGSESDSSSNSGSETDSKALAWLDPGERTYRRP